jgi:hypothetical protein
MLETITEAGVGGGGAGGVKKTVTKEELLIPSMTK